MKKIVPVGLTSNVYQKVYSIIFLLHIYIILNTINSLFFAGFQFQTKLKTPQFRPFNIKSLMRNLNCKSQLASILAYFTFFNFKSSTTSKALSQVRIPAV